MGDERDDRLAEAVRREADQGRIECARALALARDLGVSPRRVGDVCNREGIKIVACQLGCFR
jgi:hypothetical protein